MFRRSHNGKSGSPRELLDDVAGVRRRRRTLDRRRPTIGRHRPACGNTSACRGQRRTRPTPIEAAGPSWLAAWARGCPKVAGRLPPLTCGTMSTKTPRLFSIGPFLQTLWQDARFSLRVFVAKPAFTAVAVLTLALGIAVSSTVFSWIDGVLLHPYPGVSDTRGLALIETVSAIGEPLVATSYLDYRDYRDNLKLVSAVAVGRLTPLSVGADGNAERAWAELVSSNYFDVLRVRPVLGRSFLPAEGHDKPGAFPVAVISYRMWQNRYHGDPERARDRDSAEPASADDRRRRAAGVPRDDRRPRLRRVDADHHGGRDGHGPRPHLPRMPGPHLDARPAEAGRLPRAGARGGRRAGEEAGCRLPGHQPRGGGDRGAAVGRTLRHTGHAVQAARHPDGGQRAAAPDRVRQRRQPAAGPRGFPAEGVRHPGGPRGAPPPSRPAVAHRDAAPGCCRRRGRPAGGRLDGAVAEPPAALGGRPHRSAAAA